MRSRLIIKVAIILFSLPLRVSMSQKKVKITDVAKQAGVSVSTVSLVLSGKGRISDSTIEKVNQAVQQLGYVPNQAAVNLRSHQSNLIGLVIQDITDPFYTGITAGLSDQLESQGYMLFLTQAGRDIERQYRSLQSLIKQGVAGIVYNPMRESLTKTIQLLNQANMPSLCISQTQISNELDYVGPDNEQTAKMATQYLVKQGHRHIAYLGGDSQSLTRAERIAGYCNVLMQYGLPFKNEWIIECGDSQDEAIQATQQLLTKNPNITAILCHRPMTTIGAAAGVQAVGKTVGKDSYIGKQVSLLGFDDNSKATDLLVPSLSFIGTSPYEIGRQAAQQLIEKMRHPSRPTQRIIVPSLLYQRDSA